ncbi:MAG: DinB family protein [Dehalococcoidia bacterium]
MASRLQISELKEKMLKERSALITAARALNEEDALRVPVDATGEEQWTALEQLAHLWEMERAYDAWVREALAHESPSLEGVQGEPVAIPIERANGSSVEELLRHLETERAYTMGLIDGIPPESFDRTAVSPVFGTLTVLQWLRSFYRHDRQHCAQIEGRKSDYAPRFRGPEPNQRRMRLEHVAREQASR